MFSTSSFLQTTALLCICFLGSATPGIAQQAAPASNDFSNETGLDFAAFLHGNQGVSIIYKKQIGQTHIEKWQKRNAFRVLAGWYRYDTGNRYTYLRNDSTFATSSSGEGNRYFANAGWERQLTKNKFRFYFGADAGYGYNFYKSDNHTDIAVNGAAAGSDFYNGEVTTHRIEIAAFAGCNYFFFPRFSAGLELHVPVALEFSDSKIIRNGEVRIVNDNTIFSSGNDWPRLLYLSYHF